MPYLNCALNAIYRAIDIAYFLGGSVLANQIVKNKMNTFLETTSKLPTLSISHGTTSCTQDKQHQTKNLEVNEQQSEQLTTDILNRLDRANILANDDKILLAAHVLQGINDVHLQPVHHDILKEAEILKQLLKDNTTNIDESDDNNSDWIKQGNYHGKHNFSIYYKLLNNNPNKGQELSCRLDTIIPHTLLVPILSVLNESELYQTWLPCWSVPKLKVVKSEKLRQTGRCSQVVNVETEVPWPLSSRQVILKAVACDNIDSYSEDDDEARTKCLGKDGGRIIIRLQSLDCDDNIQEGLDIPPVKTGTVRMRVSGGFTVEKCTTTHPSIKDAHAALAESSEEDLVLVTFTFTVDPQLAIIPKQFINFFLRTAIGTMWNMFLNIAEGVKDGKHPAHSKAIKEKRELYEWIEERTLVMLGQSSINTPI